MTSKELSADLRTALDGVLEKAADRGEWDVLRAHAEMRFAAGEPAKEGKAAGPGTKTRFGMIGDSPAMRALYDLLAKVAPSSVPVLIQGETGTGKELVAKALHANSPRAKKRLLAENCAAVPENLLESELFGHKKGAFTGAVEDRAGHFVAADGGTVFLDEIGDMPLTMQSKLLRVLQDGEVRPVGSNVSKKVDVRVVAATHKDLPQAVKAGTFREDLLFRLNVITLYLPPLREREGDIRMLAQGLLPGICAEVGREATLTEGALEALEAWSWPGNVRELENELRRAVALSDGTIRAVDLSPRLTAAV
ncbi:Nif-specific regulatory protein [Planctomycetes bacterium Poly30]|uniref:Nif-specific regulatory protein n=1 Tax=Saltatorellus ferox TaxID=2528018 RepID=A0A518EQ62_9BACT|nr:Nif-specific regulatory protein [Planctomycetes bacterium Poly30]